MRNTPKIRKIQTGKKTLEDKEELARIDLVDAIINRLPHYPEPIKTTPIKCGDCRRLRHPTCFKKASRKTGREFYCKECETGRNYMLRRKQFTKCQRIRYSEVVARKLCEVCAEKRERYYESSNNINDESGK